METSKKRVPAKWESPSYSLGYEQVGTAQFAEGGWVLGWAGSKDRVLAYSSRVQAGPAPDFLYTPASVLVGLDHSEMGPAPH